jgi:hypothetical protein
MSGYTTANNSATTVAASSASENTPVFRVRRSRTAGIQFRRPLHLHVYRLRVSAEGRRFARRSRCVPRARWHADPDRGGIFRLDIVVLLWLEAATASCHMQRFDPSNRRLEQLVSGCSRARPTKGLRG